jgi:hypothetical protein
MLHSDQSINCWTRMTSLNLSEVSQHMLTIATSGERHLPITIFACTVTTVCIFVIKRLRTWNRDQQQQLPQNEDGRADTSSVSSSVKAVVGSTSVVPESVNYHMTRRCNYRCGFCFHTAKTSFELPLDEAKRGLRMLREAGRRSVGYFWFHDAYILFIYLCKSDPRDP